MAEACWIGTSYGRSSIRRFADLTHPVTLAEIGSLIGDPGRANMLMALMDGRALTAAEMAAHAGVTPQTASGHLSKMLAAGLIALERQGRHRYHRLASVQVARMLESVMQVAAGQVVRTGPRDPVLRAARTCYDHLAGTLGVGLADAMSARKQVEFDGDGGMITDAGGVFLRQLGIEVTASPRSKRVFCRPCLDWSERRPHLAGVVGAAIASRCFEMKWIRRLDGTRAVAVTRRGRDGFRNAFGVGEVTPGMWTVAELTSPVWRPISVSDCKHQHKRHPAAPDP